MAIRGRLSEASLPDVLQLLAMGRKTGTLTLSSSTAFGSIHFEDGRIIYAEVVNRTLAPEEAVYELFTWPDGTFNFEPGAVPELGTARVALDPQSVMLEAARRVDEWSVVAKKIPTMDLVFALDRQRLIGARYGLTPQQEALLPLIDGHRDVAALVADGGLGEFETGKAVYGLLTAEFLVPVGARATAPPPPSVSRAEAHRNLGIALYRAGMNTDARREFGRTLELEPGDMIATFFLGLVALGEGEWESAVDRMRAVAERMPLAIAPLVNASVACEQSGRLDEARQMLERAAAIDGRDEMLRINAAALALRLGATSAARAQLGLAREAMAGRVPTALWFHYAAIAAVRQRDPAGAAAILEQGLAVYPHSAPLLNNIAAVRMALGDFEGAREAAERGLAQDASLTPLRHNRLSALARLGRPPTVTPGSPRPALP